MRVLLLPDSFGGKQQFRLACARPVALRASLVSSSREAPHALLVLASLCAGPPLPCFSGEDAFGGAQFFRLPSPFCSCRAGSMQRLHAARDASSSREAPHACSCWPAIVLGHLSRVSPARTRLAARGSAVSGLVHVLGFLKLPCAPNSLVRQMGAGSNTHVETSVKRKADGLELPGDGARPMKRSISHDKLVTEVKGEIDTHDTRFFAKCDQGEHRSLWHDLPLFELDAAGKPTGCLNFVCEIPKWTRKKVRSPRRDRKMQPAVADTCRIGIQIERARRGQGDPV